MKENLPISIVDCEVVKEDHPDEYDVYQRLGVRSVIAVSVKPFPTGYVVVRNPMQYIWVNPRFYLHKCSELLIRVSAESSNGRCQS